MSDGIKLARDNKQGCVLVVDLGVYKTLNGALLETQTVLNVFCCNKSSQSNKLVLLNMTT